MWTLLEDVRKVLFFLVVAWAVLLPVSANAQELLLRFSFDQVDPSLLYVARYSSDPLPSAVPGRFNNALSFRKTGLVARGYKLDAADYPAITVTAWIKMDPEASGSRHIFSNGSDTGPELLVSGESLYARFNGANVPPPDKTIPSGEWVFVAATFDKDAGEVIFYIDGEQFVQNITQSDYDPPEEHPNPKHDCKKAEFPLQPYVFVGAQKFCPATGTGRPMEMDEVRIYAGKLADRQIAELRSVLPLPCKDISSADIDFDPARRSGDSDIGGPPQPSVLQPCATGGRVFDGPGLVSTPTPREKSRDLACRRLPNGNFLCRDNKDKSGGDYLCAGANTKELSCEPVESGTFVCVLDPSPGSDKKMKCLRD